LDPDAIRTTILAQFADPQSPTAAMKIGYVYAKSPCFTAGYSQFRRSNQAECQLRSGIPGARTAYWRAGRLEQSKTNFKKYLDLTEGNIPAKTRYVNSLFYAGDYEEVIKNG